MSRRNWAMVTVAMIILGVSVFLGSMEITHNVYFARDVAFTASLFTTILVLVIDAGVEKIVETLKFVAGKD